MSAIYLMGRIVQEEIDLYVGDCIRDGMFIQAVGKDNVYLWMVRDTGTDILCLSYLYESPIDAEITDTLLGRNKRYFVIANVDAANPEEEVMFELTQVQAKEFIQSHNESMEVCYG
jgi:hypothetical protein